MANSDEPGPAPPQTADAPAAPLETLTPPVPLPEDPLCRVEALVQRTQRSMLEGIEGLLQRQATALGEQARRTALETSEQVFAKHADPLIGRLKGALLEALEEIQGRQLVPLLERLRQAVVSAFEEVGHKHAAPFLTELADALRKQAAPAVERARDGAGAVRGVAGRLVGAVRQTVTDPVARVMTVHVPQYARRAGERVIDYAVAATLFCIAAVFLLVGGVQGLQQAGLPVYLTYLLGGLVAVGAGLVFLRLCARPWRGPQSPPDRDAPPPE